MPHYSPSKYLIQAAPPDLAETERARSTFAIYEILDKRHSPVDPRLVHTMYMGVVDMEAEDYPDPKDDMFTARLEDAVVRAWKKARGY